MRLAVTGAHDEGAVGELDVGVEPLLKCEFRVSFQLVAPQIEDDVTCLDRHGREEAQPADIMVPLSGPLAAWQAQYRSHWWSRQR